MQNSWKPVLLLFVSAAAALTAIAQAAPPGSDTLIFTNGDKLVGHFVRSTDASVTFKSDALGNLTVDWSKVRELDTSAYVAVIRKGVRLRKKQIQTNVPQGALVMRDATLQVTPAPGARAQAIPVSDSAVVIDQAAFQKALTTRPGFFSNWAGAITAGATLVQATQTNRTFTGGVSMVRSEPTEDWLNPSYRTSFAFSESYGRLTQPGAVTIKTSILHAAAEQDEFLTPSLFAFGQADFDHNYSQGLDLQQTYNGGLGWAVIKTAAQQFDLKASMSYIRQQFSAGTLGTPTASMSLVGSVFSEHYQRKFARGAVLDESLSATPAWNNTSAYSAAFGTMLTIPVYKRLSGSTSVIDSFLNDPPPGFKKNSFQFTLGVTYTLP